MIKRLTVHQFNDLAYPLLKKLLGDEVGPKVADNDESDQDDLTDSWGYFIDDRLIGVIGLGSYLTSIDKRWLGYFGVCPDCQKQGVGKKLLEHIEKECKIRYIKFLFVETYGGEKFISARKFYESNGFESCGYLRNYLRDGNNIEYYMKEIED